MRTLNRNAFFSSIPLQKASPMHHVLIGGMAMQAATLELLHRGESAKYADKITLCSQHGWIQNVSPQFESLKWGQPAHYLPPFTYKIFLDLVEEGVFSTYRSSEPMTFGMVKKIMERQMKVLSDSGINLICDEVTKISVDAGLLRIQSCTHDGKDKTIEIETGNRYMVYNAANRTRLPRVFQGMLRAQNTSSLYQSGGVFPTIGLIGCGRNASWALRDTTSKVVVFVPKGDTGLKKEYENPEYHDRIQRVSLEEIALRDLGADMLCRGFDMDRRQWVEIRLPKVACYSAFGSELDRPITENLPAENVTLIPNMPQQGKWLTGAAGASPAGKSSDEIFYALSSHKRSAASDMRDTAVPYGSMIQNFYRICEKMQLYRHLEPHAILNFHAWQVLIMDKLQALGHLNHPEGEAVLNHFFEKLITLIMHVYQDSVPRPEVIQRVVKMIAEQTLQGKTELNLSLQQFLEIVEEASPPKLTP